MLFLLVGRKDQIEMKVTVGEERSEFPDAEVSASGNPRCVSKCYIYMSEEQYKMEAYV